MTDLAKEKWYHGRISRVDAEKILDAQGAAEGMYLVRDSLTMTGEYVLSICSQVRTRVLQNIYFEKFVLKNWCFMVPISHTVYDIACNFRGAKYSLFPWAS